MNVIKVIVDEVPNGCDRCTLVDSYGNCALIGRSVISHSTPRDDYLYNKRPDWCPLILEEDVENWLMTRPQKPKHVLCADYPPMKPADGFRATVEDDHAS